MLEYLMNRESLVLIPCQHSAYQVLCLLPNIPLPEPIKSEGTLEDLPVESILGAQKGKTST